MNVIVRKTLAILLVILLVLALTYSTAPNLINWRGAEDFGYNFMPLLFFVLGIYVVYRIIKKDMSGSKKDLTNKNNQV